MNKIDVVQLLQNGQSVQIQPQGISMYPLIVSGRDSVIICPLQGHTCRRGDVVLFRNNENRLVLHRVVKQNHQGYYFVGDNQIAVEGPVAPEQIVGIATVFIRKDKEISHRNVIYRVLSFLWLLVRPFRFIGWKIMRRLRRIHAHKN